MQTRESWFNDDQQHEKLQNVNLHECFSDNNMQAEYIMHRDYSQILLAPNLAQFGPILAVPI